jgi:hypothetical protein
MNDDLARLMDATQHTMILPGLWASEDRSRFEEVLTPHLKSRREMRLIVTGLCTMIERVRAELDECKPNDEVRALFRMMYAQQGAPRNE